MRIVATAIFLGLFALAAQAQQEGPTAQQQRMKDCNAKATKDKLKGDERKSYMSSCLKGGKAQPTAQQERMKSCNKQAKDQNLAGGQRKKFMSDCLKGSA
jgi:psiF repeat-containing protein